jgi:hypothetical protein
MVCPRPVPNPQGTDMTNSMSLTEGIAGQHLALSVAAQLARTRLIRHPLRAFDAQHLGEMLDVLASALARTAPIYTIDLAAGARRELAAGEVEGAVSKNRAAVLMLKDGRELTGVSIRRADLRQAIEILKAVVLPELAPRRRAQISEVSQKPNAAAVLDGLVNLVAQMDDMLKPPVTSPQLERARSAALFIARRTPHGRVANLAMHLMTALQESPGDDHLPGGYRLTLARLRAALQKMAETPVEGFR